MCPLVCPWIERRMDANRQAVLAAISESSRDMDQRFESVVDYTRVLERVAKIEECQSSSQQ